MSSATEQPDDDLDALIQAVNEGDKDAEAELIHRILPDLHRMAKQLMRRQPPNHTLQTTALVNEMYLKLFGGRRQQLKSQRHMYCVVARAMRHKLVDHARQRGTSKRQGERDHGDLDNLVIEVERHCLDLLQLEEALKRLEQRDPTMVRLVELRVFGGRTMEEIAKILERSLRSLERDWQFARTWLAGEISS